MHRGLSTDPGLVGDGILLLMRYSILNANHMANGAITNIGFLASQLMTVHVYAHT